MLENPRKNIVTALSGASNLMGILFVSYFLSKKKLAWTISEDLHRRFLQMGYYVQTTSSQHNRYLRLFDMVFTVFRERHRYSVACVDVFNGWAFIWAEVTCAVLRLLHKPYCIVLRGARLLEFAQRWPGRMRRMLVAADRVTTPSMLFKKELVYIRSDIVCIPNLLDVSLYPFQLRQCPAPRLVWLRAFDEVYNPCLAVRILNLLVAEFSNINLVMVGPDKNDGSFQRTVNLISEFGLGDHVTITGAVDKADVPKWLNESDIYLNTTRVESFGLAVMEAAACGLPIVTTSVGELPYLWQDNINALLAPSDDPDAMASAVRRILSEPGLAERLSANARKKAEQYDCPVILPQWEKLFKEVIAHGR